jgi:hypothetical protein
LLQQRVDQLAQATQFGGVAAPTGGPGVGQPMAGGSFPRSFLIPGSDTSIRVGGQIRENVIYYFNGGNPNTSPQSTTVGDNGQALAIPVNIKLPGSVTSGAARARSTDIFLQSPRESKLNVETRTPTAWGEARTFMEFDWAGSTAYAPGGGNPTSVSDNLVPRLRFAYGTLGGILAGQANSNFSDPDANAEVIDFGGNVGEPGVVRVPQVRYTTPLAPWGWLGALSVSAETPETDAWQPTGGVIASDAGAVGGPPPIAYPNPYKAGAPDLTVAWYIPQPWGHLDFSGVLRPSLQIKDGVFVDRTFMGYGGHVGGDVKPGWFGWNQDDITFHFTWGNGIGRYLNANTNFAIVDNYPAATPTTAAAAGNILATTTVEWGASVGYQHRWLPNLRSTISGGIIHHDVNNFSSSATPVCAFSLAAGSPAQSGTGGCGINKEVITGHANLIWNPVAFVDFGLEYIYGHRVVQSGLKGDMNVLEGRMAVSF